MDGKPETLQMEPVAVIRTDFGTKFGVPRQSGLVKELTARIVFLPPYRSRDALRGIEGFTHLWLLWYFSRAAGTPWSPTVRPPRLGGNRRMGVFATRSPFRPNHIGLSSVRLLGVEEDTAEGPVLLVAGADLMDGTPILDVKPYLPYTDCHPEAAGGFTEEQDFPTLEVDFPEQLLQRVPEEKRAALIGVLAGDPRPSYQRGAEDRVYGFVFAGLEVRFAVTEGVLRVTEIRPGRE